jgi:hypothetical protein
VFEIIDGTRGGGEVEDVVDLPRDLEGMRDVRADKLEAGVSEEMGDVLGGAGNEVIDRDDLVALREEAIAKVGADEPGPTGNERPHVWLLAVDVSEME